MRLDKEEFRRCVVYFGNAKERWKTINTCMKLAVMGDHGVGKSTFMKALFGLATQDTSVAPVEDRNGIGMYNYPGAEGVTCFELPSFDESIVSVEEYLKQVEFYQYDVYLILSNASFKANDLRFGKEATKRQKTVFYVMSVALLNVPDSHNKPCPHPEHWTDDILSKIYSQYAPNMLDLQQHTSADIFLIDAFYKNLFDFNRLGESLAAKFTDMKRKACIDDSGTVMDDQNDIKWYKVYRAQLLLFSSYGNGRTGNGSCVAAEVLELLELTPTQLSSLSDVSGAQLDVLIRIVNQSVQNIIYAANKEFEIDDIPLMELFKMERENRMSQAQQSGGWLSYLFPRDDAGDDASKAIAQILVGALEAVFKTCADALVVSLHPDYQILPVGKWIYNLEGTRAFSYGSQGQVYAAQVAGAFGTMRIAVKVVQLDPDEHHAVQQTVQLDSILRKLSDLRHENVVLHYSPVTVCCATDPHSVNLPGVRCYHIPMELCSGGTLQKAAQCFLSSKIMQTWTHQILNGLAYLHCARIIHRDLKGANIFLSSLVYDTCTIKIGDMGEVKKLMTTITKPDEVTGYRGTPGFMSPEMIRGNTSEFNTGRKTDIWSLGCVVIEMLTGSLQFYGNDGSEVTGPGPAVDYFIVHEGGMPRVPTYIPEEMNAFIRSCFYRNPNDRPTANELLDAPFLGMPNVPQWLDSRPQRPI